MAARVLIVEDSSAFAVGLRTILESTGEFKIVDVVPVASGVRDKVVALRPDIVIVDLRIADQPGSQPHFRHGVALIRALHEMFPEIPVLATSFLPHRQWLKEAIQAGVSGFLDKDAPKEDFINALRALRDGRVVFTREHMELLTEPIPTDDEPLTERETEVLIRLARGMSNAEIARDLQISDGTVRVHVSRILHKLHVSNRHQAVEEAHRRGLV